MKWPFLNRLRIPRGSPDNLDNAAPSIDTTVNTATTTTTTTTVSGKTKKCGTRKLYRRARLLDLLCTVRHRARLHQAPSCCSSRLSDGFSSQELPILRTGGPVGPSTNEWCTTSSFESLAELIRYHSLALRRPIPTLASKPAAGDRDSRRRRRRSMLQELVCRPLSTQGCQSGPAVAAAAATANNQQQSAYCPTCHNMVLVLSQKRKSCDEPTEDNHGLGPSVCPKRHRPCLESYNPSFVPSTLGTSRTWRTNPVAMTDSNVESFNPTYLAATEFDDQTIYSAIADESSSSSCASGSLSSDSDSQSTTGEINERPKLVGARRTAKYTGTNLATLDQWLLHRDSYQPNKYSHHHQHSIVAQTTTTTTAVANEPTYDVIDPDGLNEAGIKQPFQSADEEAPRLFGVPCMSSTLKRVGTRTHPATDQATLYDEVASDTDTDHVTVLPGSDSPRDKAKIRPRRRYYQHSPALAHDPVKRVRREYFVCEE